jgi:hypothetical protein
MQGVEVLDGFAALRAPAVIGVVYDRAALEAKLLGRIRLDLGMA